MFGETADTVRESAAEDLSFPHVLSETFSPSPSLLSSTHICHHTRPAFSDQCQLVQILLLLGTESPLADPPWTDSVSQRPSCQRSAAQLRHPSNELWCILA